MLNVFKFTCCNTAGEFILLTLNGQSFHLYFIETAGCKTQAVWMPGGPGQVLGVSWNQDAMLWCYISLELGCCAGAVEASCELTARDQPNTASDHILTPLHSPVLCMFWSKIPAIRLRHLLAQSNTHMAFFECYQKVNGSIACSCYFKK